MQDQYYKNSITNISRMLQDVKIISQNEYPGKGFEVRYTHKVMEFRRPEVRSRAIFDGGTAYLCTLSGTPEWFEQNPEISKTILDSFQIKK